MHPVRSRPVAGREALGQGWSKRWLAIFCAAILALSGSPASAVSPWAVFFEANSARLTPQAIATLDNAAASYRAAGIRGFELFAHTDRVGTSSSNRRLARHRAEAVRAALVERGIPAHAMKINSIGEERPLVETDDGVAERQNRRVEIVITCIEDPPSGFQYIRCAG